MRAYRLLISILLSVGIAGSVLAEQTFQWRKPKTIADMQRRFWAAEIEKFAVTLIPLNLTQGFLASRCAANLPRKFTPFKLYIANAGSKPVKVRQGLPAVMLELKDGTKVTNVDFRLYARKREKIPPEIEEAFSDIEVAPGACESTLICFPRAIRTSEIVAVYFGISKQVRLEPFVYPLSRDLQRYAIKMPKGM